MENEQKAETGKARQWLQDNLRIIISILIVVTIAGGIYSYSKRNQTPSADQAGITQKEEIDGESAAQSNQATSPADKSGQQVSSAAASQETEMSFVESAGKGDGMTTLARRALANYLEKNPDTALTPEHKIYIEDFLRKNVPPERIFVGTSVEFSKGLIQNAITKSKSLNDGQLQNLHKYAVRVPSLS